jgi:predicted HicB family RNase H-like nuclease
VSDVVTYKGYQAKIAFDAEDRIFFGRVAGIEDGVGFHAESVDGLIAAFQDAVDDYISTCAKIGKRPEKAYTGKLMFRVDPELHAEAARAAKLTGQSLNAWAADALRAAARVTVSKAVSL